MKGSSESLDVQINRQIREWTEEGKRYLETGQVGPWPKTSCCLPESTTTGVGVETVVFLHRFVMSGVNVGVHNCPVQNIVVFVLLVTKDSKYIVCG